MNQLINSNMAAAGGMPHTPGLSAGGATLAGDEAAETRSLGEYLDLLLDNLPVIGGTVAVCAAVAAGYAFVQPKVYESNIMIQVEDANGGAKALFGDAAGLVEGKAQATAEMELIRSRLILQEAVDRSRLHTTMQPRYLPLIGEALGRRSDGLSNPVNGRVHGQERIKFDLFEVPAGALGQTFTVIALGDERYRLEHSGLNLNAEGRVGDTLVATTPQGEVKLHLTELAGLPGAEFTAVRQRRDLVTASLQRQLTVQEKVRGSGIINVTYRGTDPERVAMVLNEVGSQYIRQNLERRSEEATKSLAFLNRQLPQFKTQLEQSEDRYNAFRKKSGTVDVGAEGKVYFDQMINAQGKLVELKQKRVELESRYTRNHPSIKALDEQIAGVQQAINGFDAKVRQMPTLQQDALRLQRDLEASNQMYRNMMDNAMQLALVKEGKVGNSRVVDDAPIPFIPVGPGFMKILGIGLSIGLGLGGLLAFLRSRLWGKIKDAGEIERKLGLSVFGVVPKSAAQEVLAQKLQSKAAGVHVLAHTSRNDVAVESLRSLRTAMQFAMLDAKNNVVLFTGATPGVGKSFLSANFAAVMADAGKRVLLVDGDMRKGHLHRYFSVPHHGGLSEAIAGSVDADGCVHRQVLPRLDFVSTGRMPPNPAELVVSPQFNELVEGWSREYDLVIIDSPPVLLAADTAAMAANAGLVFLVARAEQTGLGEVGQSVKTLNRSGVAVNGVVFNGMDMSKRRYSYGYNYGYGYGYRYGAQYLAQVKEYSSRPSPDLIKG